MNVKNHFRNMKRILLHNKIHILLQNIPLKDIIFNFFKLAQNSAQSNVFKKPCNRDREKALTGQPEFDAHSGKRASTPQSFPLTEKVVRWHSCAHTLQYFLSALVNNIYLSHCENNLYFKGIHWQ